MGTHIVRQLLAHILVGQGDAVLIPDGDAPTMCSDWLWRTCQKLVAGGVDPFARSHGSLSALIADRQFLATYYTRPEAAALLAALALPADGQAARRRGLGGWRYAGQRADWRLRLRHRHAALNRVPANVALRTSCTAVRSPEVARAHDETRAGRLDVLNIAVHLLRPCSRAATLITPFDGECLLTMPYGEQTMAMSQSAHWICGRRCNSP